MQFSLSSRVSRVLFGVSVIASASAAALVWIISRRRIAKRDALSVAFQQAATFQVNGPTVNSERKEEEEEEARDWSPDDGEEWFDPEEVAELRRKCIEDNLRERDAERALAGAHGAERVKQAKLAQLVVEQLEPVAAGGVLDSIDWDHGESVGRLVEKFLGKVNPKHVQRWLSTDSVQLSGLGLEDFDVLIISTGLRERNPRLELLNLNGNRKLGPLGASHLASILPWGGLKLSTLFLSDCGLGDEGIAPVAHALKLNTSLKLLELRNNAATDAAAESLAKALLENNTLESLFLGNDAWTRTERQNKIGDVGTQLLVDAMLAESGALKVKIEGNPISESTKVAAQRSLGQRMQF